MILSQHFSSRKFSGDPPAESMALHSVSGRWHNNVVAFLVVA